METSFGCSKHNRRNIEACMNTFEYYDEQPEHLVLNLRYNYLPENFTGIAKTYLAVTFYKNGMVHNEQGPAVYDRKGRNEYWLFGEWLTKIKYDGHPFFVKKRLESILELT